MMMLSLLGLMACTDQKKEPPVDQTRTTSAIVVTPTMRDGHAAEPKMEEAEQPNMDKDVDEVDMSGVERDAGY
jgi:hypothetical protein